MTTRLLTQGVVVNNNRSNDIESAPMEESKTERSNHRESLYTHSDGDEPTSPPATSFSFSKCSQKSQRPTTKAKQKQESKRKNNVNTRKRQQQQQQQRDKGTATAVPIPSFTSVKNFSRRRSTKLNNNNDDILAKVNQALMLDNDGDDNDKHVEAQDKHLHAASSVKNAPSLPIPKFYYLDTDDDDDKDQQDDFLDMKPIFRKQPPPLPPPPPIPLPVIPAATGSAKADTKETILQNPTKQQQQPPLLLPAAATTNEPSTSDTTKLKSTETTMKTTPTDKQNIAIATETEEGNDSNDVHSKLPIVDKKKYVGDDLLPSTRSLIEELLTMTDLICQRSNPQTATIKSILASLESTIGFPLNRDQRKVVQEYVDQYLGGGGDSKQNTKENTKNTLSANASKICTTSTTAGGSNVEAVKVIARSTEASKGPEDVPTLSQQQKLSSEALKSSTEYLHSISDPNTTIQEVFEAMESFLGVVLTPDHQKLVESHWKILTRPLQQQPVDLAVVGTKQQGPLSNSTTTGAIDHSVQKSHSGETNPHSLTDVNANKSSSPNNSINPRRRKRTIVSGSSSKHNSSMMHSGSESLPVILEDDPLDFTFISRSVESSSNTTAVVVPNSRGSSLQKDQLISNEHHSAVSTGKSVLTTATNLVDFINRYPPPPDINQCAHQPAQSTITAGLTTIRNGRKRRFRNDGAMGETNLSLVPAYKAPAPRSRKRLRKGECALCSSCPCANGNDEVAVTTLDLSRSEADMEKTLLRRLAKLERTTESYEQQKEVVKRELKKLRRKIVKRQLDKLGLEKAKPFGDSHFLPDAEVWDETFQDMATTSLAPVVVSKAKTKLFAPNGQPTLTQMLGRRDDPKDSSEGAHDIVEGHDDVIEIDVLDSDEPIEATLEQEEGDVEKDDKGPDDEGPERPEDRSPLDWDMTDDIDAGQGGFQPADNVYRITWKCGTKSPVKNSSLIRGTGVWAAASLADGDPNASQSERYVSSWDGLFAGLESDDGIDELADMFDDASTMSAEKTITAPDLPPSELADKTLLSQHSRDLVEVMEGMIEGNADKLTAVQSLCSNWRENIAFAFTKGETELCDALENIKQSKTRLKSAVAKILEAYQRREALLMLYEQSLESARTRLQTKSNNTEQEEEVVVDDEADSSTSLVEAEILHSSSSSQSCHSSTSHCHLECQTPPHQNLSSEWEMVCS